MTIALGTAMGIAAALALPHVRAGDVDCSLFQVRVETSEYPGLEMHLCVMVPSSRTLVVRYDVSVHVAIVLAR